MCGVSKDRSAGFSVVCRLHDSGMVGSLVRFCVPLVLSFEAMPGLCCFLRATKGPPSYNIYSCTHYWFCG